jgi:hypothetical protein
MSSFYNDLKHLINVHSVENDSNTPDYILAQYLMECLKAYEHATQARLFHSSPNTVITK